MTVCRWWLPAKRADDGLSRLRGGKYSNASPPGGTAWLIVLLVSPHLQLARIIRIL